MLQIRSSGPAPDSLKTPKPSPATRARAQRKAAKAPAAVKASAIKIPADASVDTALAILLQSTRDHWTANAVGVQTGDADAVHQFRVGLRRFRSVLSLFRKYIPEAQRQWANAEAKWVLSEFGPVRDLDVFKTELLPSVTEAKHKAGMRSLERTAEKARAAALRRAQEAATSNRYARFMSRLDTWLAGAGWRAARGIETKDGSKISAAQFGCRAINKRVLKILAHGKSLEALPVDDLHKIRIAIKKVRYGIEFLDSVLPEKRVRRLWRKLKALQDKLGHLNDVAAAEDIIKLLKAAPGRHRFASAGEELIAWHRRLADQARPDTEKCWRELRKVALF